MATAISTAVDAPTEVLALIFKHLPLSDIQQVRLVCRQFNNIASEFLVSSVTFWTHPDSLRRLLQISHHPIFHRTVRQICFSTESYDEGIDTELEYEAVWGMPYRLSREELTQAFQVYREAALSQRELRREDSGFEGIATALSLLPNITDVTVTGDYCSLELPDRIRAGVLGMSQVADWEDWVPKTGREFRVMFRALSVTRKQISNMRILGNLHVFTLPEDLHYVRSIGQHLTSFDIHLRSHKRNDRVRHITRINSLRSVLSAAQGLKDLSLRLFPDPLSGTSLIEVIGHTSWPHLRHAHFGWIHTSHTELIGFFERHKSSLRSVLLDVMILEGSWTDVFNFMQRSLCLDYFKLFFPGGGGISSPHVPRHYLEIARRYVLSRGDIEPLRDLRDLGEVGKYGPEHWSTKSGPGNWWETERKRAIGYPTTNRLSVGGMERRAA
ncbi:MAG: hypothetical protein M1839_002440 [Geoglossum umbratile]|nr:MAG: hypothetical protein M1839_002440 [Geoglossum umbratile]